MNKVALITGGSRGIGLGIARCLAEKGFDLAINGVREASAVKEVLQELADFGVKVIYCQGNIALKEGREAILAKIEKDFGRLNILVNNAGVAPRVRKDMLDLEEDDFDYMMNINQKGTFFMSQAVANWMLKQKEENAGFKSCIVNITSISARAAGVNRAEYCMSKASLSMMNTLFAIRLSEAQIPVYEVQPGVIDTDMTAGVKEKYTKLAEDGYILEGRMGKPDDIGKTVAALVTGQMPYITGQMIAPDGGLGIWVL